MAKEETEITHAIISEAYKSDCFLSKNVRGLFTRWKKGDRGQPIRAGWGENGASDLIGFMPVTITPEMVGKTVAVFVAVEVKTEAGIVSDEQSAFLEIVKKKGGISGVLRDISGLKNLLQSVTDRAIK